ncbi:AzlD domain-containing protein [Nocardioides marmoriginsengisoli]|uniref:AzlD domain-containing protein n=1 Tax=Nocardioides marmoriginsengisoli TaxID=661483 RepID=A0A3N0CPW0_9ACTN|nr:AzlD domain-containing protein [Nocardioides marmoriginsengisoli]RNL65066.1 AzlD domain-containing protein [Nocardioides marmoriginsengisoli]
MTWIAILACAAGCYGLKLAGLSVPARVLESRLVQRIADLLPVALLAALIGVQVFATGDSSDQTLAIDARLAGLGAAAVALLLRAPFLVVVLVSALTAALLRLL